MRREAFRNLIVAAAALLCAVPGHAGELRVLLEGETGLRNDGNLRQQARQAGQSDPRSQGSQGSQQSQNVGRAGFHLQLSYNAARRFDLALGYSPSYERSFDDSSLAGAGHRLDLGLHGALTRRLALDVRERLLSTPGLDLYTPSTAPESIAVTRRGRQLSHSLDLGLRNELTRRSALKLGLSNSVRRFENGDLADSRSIGADVGAAFHFDRERELEFTAGMERFSWERGREARVRSLEGRYALLLGRSLRLRLEAGSFYVEQKERRAADPVSLEPFTASKTGWRGGVQISQERRLLRWNLGYRHDVAPGYGVARPVEADNAFFGVSTNVRRRLTLGADANGSRQRDLSSAQSGPLTELAAGTLRMSWGFTPALRLTGGYSRVWQRSHVQLFDDLSYNRYFLGLAFRIYQTGDRPRGPEELERGGAPSDANAQPDIP